MKKAPVEWTEECQSAFEHLKQLCSQTPILAYANYQKLLNYIQMLVRMVWELYFIKSRIMTQSVSQHMQVGLYPCLRGIMIPTC